MIYPKETRTRASWAVRYIGRAAAVVLAGACLAGCNVNGGGPLAALSGPANASLLPSAAGVGVTTGGAEDIAYARRVIQSGGIPSPDAMVVQGLLSEHSIEVAPPPADADILYATAALAWNRQFDVDKPLATVVLGFGSTVDPNTFQRKPQNLAIVIDVSGSMGDPIDADSGKSKLRAVKDAVHRMLLKLNAGDLVSLVKFDSRATLLLEAVAGDSPDLAAAVDELQSGNTTDMSAGMRVGFEAVQKHLDASRQNRILVLTDALPNQGFTSTDEFIDLLRQHQSESDIGCTMFGVGLDFGQSLAADISQVRGGNFVFLSDYDRTVKIFDEDFDFLVSPIAYDVKLSMTIADGFDLQDLHGIAAPDGASRELKLTIPTLFFSSRQGGGSILVRLHAGAPWPADAVPVANVRLAFQRPDGIQQDKLGDLKLPAGTDPSGEKPYFETPGAQRAVLLLNEALALRAACEAVSDQEGVAAPSAFKAAADRLGEFLTYFDALAAGLSDQAEPTSRKLSEERALVSTLRENLLGRAEPSARP